MPIQINQDSCPKCGECCVEGCSHKVICAITCCGCCHLPVLFGPNQKIYAGTILAQSTEDQLFYKYDPTDDTLDIPRGISVYSVETNENGEILKYSSMFVGSLCNKLEDNMWVCGIFRIEDVIGNLAAALNYPGFGAILVGEVNGTGLWKLH